MIKTYLEENFWFYTFEAPNKDHLPTNIYVLKNNEELLLIDTGYEHHMKAVLKDLKGTIKIVLPSHYHPDHIDGSRCIKDAEIIGNAFAEITVENYMPDCGIKATCYNDDFTFGKFHIRLTHAPGHSDCSVLIHINDTYLHVGDLYMTKNKKDILPYVKLHNIDDHIHSLEKILDFQTAQLLLAHGTPLETETYIPGIHDRITYMKRIQQSNNTCSVEEAIQGLRDFEFRKWRNDI